MSMKGIDCNLHAIGGHHVLSHMNTEQLRDHLMCRLPIGESTVLHVQHDSLMFRGAGDEMDAMENMCWFLDQMMSRYEQVFITFHGKIEFEKSSWLHAPVNRLMQNILRRQWLKQVIPVLNRCVVLVHSEPHVQLLQSQGCDTSQVFIHPTNRHADRHSPDMSCVRVVVPGQLKDRKRVGLAIETCTKIPNCVLTVASSDPGLVDHWKRFAEPRDVHIEFTNWSSNSDEYLDQLSEHDVALVMYSDDVPLSGSIIDAMRCGLIVGASETPSFKWFAQEYQCVHTHSNYHKLGERILEVARNVAACDRDCWHADNYFTMSHDSASRLIDQYRGQHPIETRSVNSRATRSKPVTSISKQVTSMPRHLPNTSECEQLRRVDGMFHVEHQHLHDAQQFQNEWTGLMHGPFFRDVTTLNRTTGEQLTSTQALNNCSHLHVTNTALKTLIEPYVDCSVDVLKLTRFPPVETYFDVIGFLASDHRVMIHAGWWCKNMKSYNLLSLRSNWSKLMHQLSNDPTRELMDMQGGLHKSARWCSAMPYNCVHFVDQTTDDVVDEQMLHCIRSNTPVLIRRNATVIEYLGSDYVLMFDDVKTTGGLLTDDNIKLAHEQLKLI